MHYYHEMKANELLHEAELATPDRRQVVDNLLGEFYDRAVRLEKLEADNDARAKAVYASELAILAEDRMRNGE